VASGIKIEDLVVGEGPAVERGQGVAIRWRGALNRGDEFGSGEVSFVAGGRRVVTGLSRGVIGMRVGGVRRIRVSPHLGYGNREVAGVPANAVLVFEVELLGVDGPTE
jgi:FKBP-type peptidyl-prolyl cis-trans isomerase